MRGRRRPRRSTRRPPAADAGTDPPLHDPSRMIRGLSAALPLLASLAGELPPAAAWTPESQVRLATAARELAPSDFRRQLERHRDEYRRGVLAPFRDDDSAFHEQNDDGTGQLRRALETEVRRTVAMIRGHEPFREIAFQAGVVAHYVNDANNPLNCSRSDPREPTYFADYLEYLESTEDRIQTLFYGLSDELEAGDLAGFVERTLERCRSVYPLVGQEYRRIGRLPGTRYFDDRSTAFGLSGMAHSRAVTDTALVLRHIWIEAGGRDWRKPPKEAEGRFFLLPSPATRDR